MKEANVGSDLFEWCKVECWKLDLMWEKKSLSRYGEIVCDYLCSKVIATELTVNMNMMLWPKLRTKNDNHISYNGRHSVS